MAKKAIYIDIDDISTSKRDDGVTKIDIKEGARVYRRAKTGSGSSRSSFKRSGTVTKTGVKNTPEEQQKAVQEQQRQQEIQQQNREKRQAQQEQQQRLIQYKREQQQQDLNRRRLTTLQQNTPTTSPEPVDVMTQKEIRESRRRREPSVNVGPGGATGKPNPITTTPTEYNKKPVTFEAQGEGVSASGDIVEGTYESRIIDYEQGIPTTQVYFIPKGPGSEMKVTDQNTIKKFREVQKEVTSAVYLQEERIGIGGAIDNLTLIGGRNQTANLRSGNVNTIGFIKSFGAGVAVSGLETVQFVGSTISRPRETLSNIPEGIIQISRNIESGKFRSNIRYGLQGGGGFFAGKLTGEIAQDVLTGKTFSFIGKQTRKFGTVISPRYKRITTRKIGGEITGFKSIGASDDLFRSIKVDDLIDTGIKEINDIKGVGKIQLIPGQPNLPLNKLSPDDLKNIPSSIKNQPGFKGAFGYSDEFIESYAGQVGPVTTSARDLIGFKSGSKENFFGTKIKLSPRKEYGDIALFASPFEKETGQAVTRISRLGTNDKAGFLDFLSGNFQITRNRPQIVIFPEQRIGDFFTTKRFTPGEFEVTTIGESVIRKTGKPGVTLIDDQRVPIITAERVIDGDINVNDIVDVGGKKFSGFTREELSYRDLPVLETGPIKASSINIKNINSNYNIESNNTGNLSYSSLVSAPSSSSSFTTNIISSSPRSSGSSRRRSSRGGSSPIDIVSSSPSIPTSPPIISSSPALSSSPPPIISPGKSDYYNPFKQTSKPTPSIKIPKPIKQPKQFGSFTAQVRRGGTFFNIGRFKTPGAAFRAGREKVSGTLAATFRVQGVGKLPKAPRGFRVKQTKSGPEFIERRSFRLSKPTEIKEIQLFGKAKPKRKKKKRIKK